MELDVSYDFENEQQFWDELDDTVAKDCPTSTLIDNALRSYLSLTTTFRGKYIKSDYDVARCSYKLHSSPLFETHSDYVRRQLLHSLLQDDDSDVLRVAVSFLLADARENESTFELMKNEGAFCRLVDLISEPQKDEETGLHRMFMELLYEMSRIQKITTDDLLHVTDEFITNLFQIIEQISNDVHDPYHYPVIRILLVLNEQFMVAAHDPTSPESSSVPLTNKVIKVLSSHGSKYKSLGENIILLLNREDETSLQLLTLKLLYLLFTTPQTYEYFYTNDLRVLLDILIRNLLDLPEDASALRHTYLRVLYPLLAHTQLRHPPQYKREEIRKLLTVLARGQLVDTENGNPVSVRWGHFEDVDDTTKRLVSRCQKVAWLADAEAETVMFTDSPTDDRLSAPASPISPVKGQPPAIPAPRKLMKRRTSGASGLNTGSYLRPQLESARQSSLSMMEMAVQREKPGVITPSRNPSRKEGLRAVIFSKKEKPPPPQTRRSGWVGARDDKHSENLGEIHKADVQEFQSHLVSKGKEDLAAAVADRANPTSSPESRGSTSAPLRPITYHKKPPPAPKRRWRGKHSKEQAEVGDGRSASGREPGKFSSSLPSITMTNSTVEDSSVANQSPFTSIDEKTLTLSPAPADDMPKSSVKDALGEAHAEAISGIRETLEKATLGPDAVEEQLQEQPQSTPSRGVLAPPGLAPERGVPGPRFEMERSPFLSDQEELTGEESE